MHEWHEVSKLWRFYLPEFGEYRDFHEEWIICWCCFGGRLAYKIPLFEQKLEAMFPDEYTTLSNEEIIVKHFGREAFDFLMALQPAESIKTKTSPEQLRLF